MSGSPYSLCVMMQINRSGMLIQLRPYNVMRLLRPGFCQWLGATLFIFLLVTIAYAGVWLALAILFSVTARGEGVENARGRIPLSARWRAKQSSALRIGFVCASSEDWCEGFIGSHLMSGKMPHISSADCRLA